MRGAIGLAGFLVLACGGSENGKLFSADQGMGGSESSDAAASGGRQEGLVHASGGHPGASSGGRGAGGREAADSGRESTGGETAAGGSGTGGELAAGGATSSGGTVSTGGAQASGGTTGSGGAAGSGGSVSTGGMTASGGSSGECSTPPTCGAREKICGCACVNFANPRYGCGSTGCLPCGVAPPDHYFVCSGDGVSPDLFCSMN